MLSYITTYGLMLLYYSFFLKTVKTGFKKNSGQLKDILSGKGEPVILFSRLISGIFLLGFGTVTLFEKENVDLEIFTLTWNDYNTYVWVIIAIAIIMGMLLAFKKIHPSNNSSHSLPLHLLLSLSLIHI